MCQPEAKYRTHFCQHSQKFPSIFGKRYLLDMQARNTILKDNVRTPARPLL
jgi:hypothetical protein